MTILGLALGACGTLGGADAARHCAQNRGDLAARYSRPQIYHAPPPVEVCGDGRTVLLNAWSFCWGGQEQVICADGAPPAKLPDVGNATEVIVSVSEPLTFKAEFREAGGTPCESRSQRAALETIGEGRYRLRPHGFAGKYDVTLFGGGTNKAQVGGDLAVTFRWQSSVDGPLPTPEAKVDILAGRNGTTDSYGVDLDFTNLRRTARTATARAVVTSANGSSMVMDLSRETVEQCIPEGSLRFVGSLEQGRAAAALGPPPFMYDVIVEIDGRKHRATARWPDDVDEECSPCVPLRFQPALPALKE